MKNIKTYLLVVVIILCAAAISTAIFGRIEKEPEQEKREASGGPASDPRAGARFSPSPVQKW